MTRKCHNSVVPTTGCWNLYGKIVIAVQYGRVYVIKMDHVTSERWFEPCSSLAIKDSLKFGCSINSCYLFKTAINIVASKSICTVRRQVCAFVARVKQTSWLKWYPIHRGLAKIKIRRTNWRLVYIVCINLRFTYTCFTTQNRNN